MRRLLPLLLLAALAVAACGGSGGATTQPEPATTAAPEAASTAAAEATADVFPAEGDERATVVLYHGWTDLEPDGYLPWIRHLTGRGVTVIWPRYQRSILSLPATMLRDAEAATRAGLAEAPPTGPVIAAGYSLGGGLAVVYAANAAAWSVPEPAAVYGVFPAMPPAVPDPFGSVPEATTVALLTGADDAVVGAGGAEQLAAAIAPHPATIDEVPTTAALTADHFAPKRDDPAAQRAFWAPLDRIVDQLAPR